MLITKRILREYVIPTERSDEGSPKQYLRFLPRVDFNPLVRRPLVRVALTLGVMFIWSRFISSPDLVVMFFCVLYMKILSFLKNIWWSGRFFLLHVEDAEYISCRKLCPFFVWNAPFLPKKPPFWGVLANILHFLQKKLQKVLEVKKKAIPLHPLSETNSTTTQSNAWQINKTRK